MVRHILILQKPLEHQIFPAQFLDLSAGVYAFYVGAYQHFE